MKYYKKAKNDFVMAIEIDPLHIEGYINLGQVLLLKNHFEEAHENFHKALKIIPNIEDVIYEKDRCEQIKENIDDLINLSVAYKKYIHTFEQEESFSAKSYHDIKNHYRNAVCGGAEIRGLFLKRLEDIGCINKIMRNAMIY